MYLGILCNGLLFQKNNNSFSLALVFINLMLLFFETMVFKENQENISAMQSLILMYFCYLCDRELIPTVSRSRQDHIYVKLCKVTFYVTVS
jgi:ABC-type multidrug transport system permease subunit